MTNKRLALILAAAFVAGTFVAPTPASSQPARAQDAVTYHNNAWACSQAAATVSITSISPTQISFYNDGPDEVFIEIDGTAATTSDHKIDSGQSYTYTLREGYVRSISCICSTGETATVRVDGAR